MVEGKPCIVFVGLNEHLYLPASALSWMEDELKRLIETHESQTGLKVGKWEYSRISEPKTWNVGVTDAGKIAAMVDRGLPLQQMLSMSAEIAKDLGARLLESSANSTSPPVVN